MTAEQLAEIVKASVKNSIDQVMGTMYWNCVVMIIIAAILLIFVFILIGFSISATKQSTKTLLDSAKANVDYVTRLENIIKSYDKIESSTNLIATKSESIQEILETMQAILSSMIMIQKEVKTEAGSIRHETIQQNKSFEGLLTKFKNDFSTSIQNTSNDIEAKLQSVTKIMTDEISSTKNDIDRSLEKERFERNNAISQAIDTASKRTFTVAVSTIVPTLVDVGKISTEKNYDSLNECLSEMRRLSISYFKTMEKICKSSSPILKIVNNERQNIEKTVQPTSSLASNLSDAKEGLAIVTGKYGLDRIVKEGVDQNVLPADSLDRILQEINDTNKV